MSKFEEQSQFGMESYDIHISFDGSLKDFQDGFIQNYWKLFKEQQIPTYHTNKDEKQYNSLNINEFICTDAQLSDTSIKLPKIECSLSTIVKTTKCKQGRPKETKNILQLLKNQTITFLNMLSSFKILSKQQQQCILKCKQESCSIKNFKSIFQHKNIREKVDEYYKSTQFIKAIMSKPRINMTRKLQIIKNINIFGQILTNKNYQQQ